jgi:hypothetical protein
MRGMIPAMDFAASPLPAFRLAVACSICALATGVIAWSVASAQSNNRLAVKFQPTATDNQLQDSGTGEPGYWMAACGHCW